MMLRMQGKQEQDERRFDPRQEDPIEKFRRQHQPFPFDTTRYEEIEEKIFEFEPDEGE
jgi:hypothetical protein